MKQRFLSAPPRCFDEGHRVVVPINLPSAVEYETVLDSVVQELASVSSELRRRFEAKKLEGRSKEDHVPSLE